MVVITTRHCENDQMLFFCQGQNQRRKRRRRKRRRRRGWNFCSRQALGGSAVTRHLQSEKTQNGVPAGPTSVGVKRPGEEKRTLQARLGPRPVSVLSSEIHHPESLATNSQLPLKRRFADLFRDLSGGVQKPNSP